MADKLPALRVHPSRTTDKGENVLTNRDLRIVGCVAFLFLTLGNLSVKADTVTFTFDSPLDSPFPGEVISFSLQQGQAPDLLEPCGCGSSAEEQNAVSAYFNVPILANGVSEISTVNFCDRSCDNFTDISVGNLAYLGGNSEPWTGLLSAPRFTPGSYQSMVSCFGAIVPKCENFPNTNPLLTITDTVVNAPENSTISLLLLGLVAVITARRKPASDAASAKGRREI
jgi:hypothetical protein